MLKFIIRFIARKCLSAEWIQLRARIEDECRALASSPDLAPPLAAQKLLVSGEDRRHGHHPGYDMRAIGRAIWRRITSGRREGASTIEQQIVRVLTGRYERCLTRKIREILLASLVAAEYPKSILPALYLQVAYYGWRMNGFAAARRRLRLSTATMSLGEAAFLVARLKYPEPRVAPQSRIRQIDRRRDYLVDLYLVHSRGGTYEYLDAPRRSGAVRSAIPVAATARALSAAR